MLVENLKETCESLGWLFNYGAGHWQNLLDAPLDYDLEFEDRKKYFLLLWKDRTYKLNNFNGIEGYIFDGEFILCVRSKISDPDYNWKYEVNIQKLEKEIERMFSYFDLCGIWKISFWKEIEVENDLDTNMDGLKVRFKLETR